MNWKNTTNLEKSFITNNHYSLIDYRLKGNNVALFNGCNLFELMASIMKLVDFVQNLSNTERQSTIYQENLNDWNSDIIVVPEEAIEENGNEMTWIQDGKTYHYLIEVFTAAEVLEDWNESLGYKPTLEESAKRLYDYAINDA